MGRKFLGNIIKSKEKKALTLLKEEVSQIVKKYNTMEEYLHRFEDKLEEVNQGLENNQDIIQKSLRFEYKSSQEILKRLNQIDERVSKTLDNNEKYIEFEQARSNLIKEKDFILAKNIQWLDDIDLICDKMDGQGQEYWIQLLKSWQKQIIDSLKGLGIYEINSMGKTFNHEVAESISTKRKEVNKDYLPYEVIDVLQRGFVLEDGTLLRKEKVITIEEEEGRGEYEQ